MKRLVLYRKCKWVSGVLIGYSEKVMISSVAGLRSNEVNRYPLPKGSCMDQFSKWRWKELGFTSAHILQSLVTFKISFTDILWYGNKYACK